MESLQHTYRSYMSKFLHWKVALCQRQEQQLNVLTFETVMWIVFFFATCVTNRNHSFILTPQIPLLTDQLNKTGPSANRCWRHQLSELWLERLNRDILNNYGRSCRCAEKKQGDSLWVWQVQNVASAQKLSQHQSDGGSSWALAGRNCITYRERWQWYSTLMQERQSLSAILNYTGRRGRSEGYTKQEADRQPRCAVEPFWIFPFRENYTWVLSCTLVILRWTGLHINWCYQGWLNRQSTSGFSHCANESISNCLSV